MIEEAELHLDEIAHYKKELEASQKLNNFLVAQLKIVIAQYNIASGMKYEQAKINAETGVDNAVSAYTATLTSGEAK